MMDNIFPKIHKEGYKFLAISIIFTLAVLLFSNFLGIIFINDRPSSYEYYLAVIGLSAISFHCIFLDALLWINKFPKLHE